MNDDIREVPCGLYVIQLGSETFVPADDFTPERRTVCVPLTWRAVSCPAGLDPVRWAIQELRALAEIPFTDALDDAQLRLEAARMEEWPSDAIHVDHARFEGAWTDGQRREILAVFPTH